MSVSEGVSEFRTSCTATAVVSGRHHRRLESHLCVRVSWRQPLDRSGTLLAGLAFPAGDAVATVGRRDPRSAVQPTFDDSGGGPASQGLWALPRAFAGRSVDHVAG